MRVVTFGFVLSRLVANELTCESRTFFTAASDSGVSCRVDIGSEGVDSGSEGVDLGSEGVRRSQGVDLGS